MFKFRLLLSAVGVLGIILGTESYSYGYGGSIPTQPTYFPGGVTYSYNSVLPTYPSYVNQPTAFGNFNYGQQSYGSSSSTNSCNSLKVLEVLDRIFCQHTEKRRYSSTIYNEIETVIDQSTTTLNMIFLPTAYDYLNAAISNLQTLQDSTYGNYGDSSLLQSYDETTQTEATGTENTGTSATTTTTTLKGTPSRVTVTDKLATAKADLEVIQQGVKTFTVKRTNAQNTQTSTSNSNAEVKETQIEIDIKETKGKPAVVQSAFSHNKQKRRIKLNRRARGAEFSDYTCALLPASYCDEDQYDELLFNILDRMFTSLDLMFSCMQELWDFAINSECGDIDTLFQVSVAFGRVDASVQTLLEAINKVSRIYEIVDLDNDSTYGERAKGTSSSPMMVMGGNKRPMTGMATINRSPAIQGYPFNGYVSQQQQYRVGRMVSKPATTLYFVS